MEDLRLQFLNQLDGVAATMATQDLTGSQISEGILRTISELYVTAKVEKQFESDHFEVAYHSRVTASLNF